MIAKPQILHRALGERRRQQAERLRGWRDQCLGLFGELDQELSEDTVTGITHQLQDILRDHLESGKTLAQLPDKVTVQLTPYDLTKGRITYRAR